MPYVTVGRENTADIRVHYDDHGTGAPIILVHGYLADGRSWEKQETALLSAGYRVITYDRRGGGASSRPAAGYDYDTLAADLNVLLEKLDLRDAVLAGCCSGTGEVTRYLGTYGQRRVRGAALLAPLPPFLPRSAANPEGLTRASMTRSSPNSPPTARRRSRPTWTGTTTSTCSAAPGSATRHGRTASTPPSGCPRPRRWAARSRGGKTSVLTLPALPSRP